MPRTRNRQDCQYPRRPQDSRSILGRSFEEEADLLPLPSPDRKLDLRNEKGPSNMIALNPKPLLSQDDEAQLVKLLAYLTICNLARSRSGLAERDWNCLSKWETKQKGRDPAIEVARLYISYAGLFTLLLQVLLGELVKNAQFTKSMKDEIRAEEPDPETPIEILVFKKTAEFFLRITAQESPGSPESPGQNPTNPS